MIYIYIFFKSGFYFSGFISDLPGQNVTADVTRPFPSSHSLSWRSAFCFLFSMPTHTPITASLCGQLAGNGWAQVSSTPAAGPGLRLYMDCLSVFLSLNSCLAPLTNIAVLSFLIWSLQYLLPLFALLSLYFQYLLFIVA